jgi:hypothetical protein
LVRAFAGVLAAGSGLAGPVRLIAVVCGVCAFAPAARAGAPPAIPAGMEEEILGLVRAARPEGCALASVRISTAAIAADLACGADRGTLVLDRGDAAPTGVEAGRSRSFRVTAPAGASPALRARAADFAARLAATDDGTFWQRAARELEAALGAPPLAAAARPAGAPHTPPPRRFARIDDTRRALTWFGLLAGLAWLAFSARSALRDGSRRRLVLAVLGVFVLALALRLALPPQAPLHDNTHGVAELGGLTAASSGTHDVVDAERYGVAWRQVMRGCVRLWDGGYHSVLRLGALLGALAVIPAFFLGARLGGAASAGLLAALAVASYPAHVVLSPTQGPMAAAGTLWLAGLGCGWAGLDPAATRGRRLVLLWCAALALAACAELAVTTMALPVAAAVLLLLMPGARRWRELLGPAAWVALALAVHAGALLGGVSTAVSDRPAGSFALWQRLFHEDLLLDPRLMAPGLTLLALAGLLALWRSGQRRAALAALGAFAVAFVPSLGVVACRGDLIRYQTVPALLLAVLAGAAVPLVARALRRPGAAAAACALVLAATAAPGLASTRVRPLDAAAWDLLVRAAAAQPRTVTVHLAPERMGFVVNRFPRYVLAEGGRDVRTKHGGVARGEGACLVWIGPPCHRFAPGELQAGLAALPRLGGDPIRRECGAVAALADVDAPGAASARLEVPWRDREFIPVVAARPLVGLFPCRAAGGAAPSQPASSTRGEP